jgi:RHH-type proline utilization regulon transcriptional repressor/proline dehydrogenase/delta 1-pyrroline-5-carboxylate dehydrogenase
MEPMNTVFVNVDVPAAEDPLRAAITRDWLADETSLLKSLSAGATIDTAATDRISQTAAGWIRALREHEQQGSMLDAFLREYGLSSREGVLLMCLAEALLRVPDAPTAEKLIADIVGGADWARHLGRSESLLVNASTWGLLLTGRLVRLEDDDRVDSLLGRLVSRTSEPLVRLALRQAMRLMGEQFVMGQDIASALRRARDERPSNERHSFDMLGEAALTARDADQYFQRYRDAIAAIGEASIDSANEPVESRPGISVKLSALHPRYEEFQRERVRRELRPRLLQLAIEARAQNIGLTVDAEEADRLELSLDLIESVFADDALAGWTGFGLAVQAVQKRAPAVIDWLAALAARVGRRIAVRLVKGAYWDSEIQWAQERGLSGYPVWTHKTATDVAYLACARKLLDAGQARIYPMFATHNAHTIAWILEAARTHPVWEFQRLHGMGEALYALLHEQHALRTPVRVYAPVGSHEALLPYLVRRLLENGANTGFVHRIFDPSVAPEALAADPVRALAMPETEIPALPLPAAFYPDRTNSRGLQLTDRRVQRELAQALRDAAPMTASWTPTDSADVPGAVDAAREAHRDWDAQPVAERAAVLEDAADALQAHSHEFMHLLIREAGKTIPDALGELREAVDFLRYYAQQARSLMGTTSVLPGPAGERNELRLRGRGVFACISPWNFPLSIFTGQIAAALVTGNAVIAKPAEQTPLVALRMARLWQEVGLPRNVLRVLPGDGELGAAIVRQNAIAGVAFTGSFEVARAIAASLAARRAPLATLIAETGGQNALIADSSALPEQLVRDALRSAFGSAGQRCSALRVLYVQDDIAERVIELLRGAMRELHIGDPALLATDMGPVIDEDARRTLLAHVEALAQDRRILETLPLPAGCMQGSYVAPVLAEIPGIGFLKREHFGPILHLVRYRADDLDAVVDDLNASGFGLTLGIHSRIESTWRRIAERARVGNVYVNRPIIGAVVGSQPFGGEGWSGTGPKAGGPHYLPRFVAEQALCINTAAMGGNATLLAGPAP